MMLRADEKIRYDCPEYWDRRYSSENHYEWLQQGYVDTLNLLDKEIGRKDAKILILGCGNSRLSVDLYKRGFHHIVSTDISKVCIAKQQERYRDLPGLSWLCSDMTNMSEISRSSFDAVVEKATLDALLAAEKSPWDVNEVTAKRVHSALLEISRVLKNEGKFFSVTFSQPHFRLPHLAKTEFGWGVQSQVLNKKDSFHFYCFTMTKGNTLDEEVIKRTKVSNLTVVNNPDAYEQSWDAEKDHEFLARIQF